MKTEQEIKQELSVLLGQDKVDYTKVLSLTNELSVFDTDNVRFSVDAGVIDRLGNELVARQETAVSELVKNAYDADATNVTLTFINSTVAGGTLIIDDNGSGMTRDQLINGFMRISSTDKLKNPLSGIYKRKRAGQKGIGRFAVQRLGLKLTIITAIESAEKAHQLTIDWNDYTGDKNLIDITNIIDVIDSNGKSGTKLIIEGLRDKWTEAAIRRIYRYVSEIMQPFPLSAVTISDNVDPGFKTMFYLSDGISQYKVADEKAMIYDHAIAIIEGAIDANHKANYQVVSKKLSIDFSDDIGLDPDDKSIIFDQLANVRFKAYYFIYEPNLIPKMHLTSIKKLANIMGGIRLYRNGFRVLPYGEPGDDWLKLDESVRKRSILPVHQNTSFFGFVEINDNSGSFEETSSREGLMNNDALIQLQNFTYRSILNSVIKIAEQRNIKIVSGQTKDEKGRWEQIEVRVKNIAYTLDELDKALEFENESPAIRSKRKKKVKELKKEIEDVQKLQKEETVKLFKERSMLRVLSSVGLTVGQFVHEIKYYLDSIQDDIRTLLVDLNKNMQALERLGILDVNFSHFKTYMSYFDSVISLNIIKELKPIELRSAVRPFVKSLKSDAAKVGIEFIEPEFFGYHLYTKPMHPSEWSSILFNLYTNAKKAIKRRQIIDDGKIYIECGFTEKYVYLEFSDNGDGISKENEEKIFEEFFTTTSQLSLESIEVTNEITGTGLGLKIVKDIVSSYRGNIMVVSPKQEYSTCIRIEIPKANETEI